LFTQPRQIFLGLCETQLGASNLYAAELERRPNPSQFGSGLLDEPLSLLEIALHIAARNFLPPTSQLRRSTRLTPRRRLRGGRHAAGGQVCTEALDGLRMIAVGTPIAGRPRHRSVRAQFGHTAPPSGVDGDAR